MITLRSIIRSLWEAEQPPLSVATLAAVAREQRSREDAHEHAMALGREHKRAMAFRLEWPGEHPGYPFASDPFDARCVRVVSTAVWELEQQAKGTPERRIAPIPMRASR